MRIVNEAEFKEVVKEGVTLVDFFATWCGPCKALAPVLEEVSADYPNVKFIKVDVDECENLAATYSIMSIPTLYVLNNGELVSRTGGFQDKTALKAFIDQSLTKI